MHGMCRLISTVMILSFRTVMSWQIVQTQIRLFLEEKSDQGLRVHCLPFCLNCLDALVYGKATLSELANFQVSEILGFLRYLCCSHAGFLVMLLI